MNIFSATIASTAITMSIPTCPCTVAAVAPSDVAPAAVSVCVPCDSQLLWRDLEALDRGGTCRRELQSNADLCRWVAGANNRFHEPSRPFLRAYLAVGGQAGADPQATENAVRFARLASSLDHAVVEILNRSATADLAMSALATFVERVPDDQLALKIMNNKALLGHRYTHLDLLADIASINLTMVNARKVLGRLGNPKLSPAKGSCYEVRAAAWLKQNRNEEVESWDGRMGRREYDFKTTAGNVCQCKTSGDAFDTTQREVAWSQLALQQTAARTYRQVKWFVPGRDNVPGPLCNWFAKVRKDTGQDIEVIPVELPW